MTKERVTAEDLKLDAFYAVPKIFEWNPRYRENLSSDAKLLYGKIRDRFSLSLQTNNVDESRGDMATYMDEEGNPYCILVKMEVQFILRISAKTAEKAIKELEKMDLIDIIQEKGKPSRLYLNKPLTEGFDMHSYRDEYQYFKYIETCKKKGREIKLDLAYFIMEGRKRRAKKGGSKISPPVDNQPEKEGSKISPPVKNQEESVDNEGEGSRISPPRGGKVTPPGGENFPPSNTDLSNTDLSNTDYKEIQETTSSEAEEKEVVAGEGDSMPQIVADDNYKNIIIYLEQEKSLSTMKALNIIKKGLMESKVALVKHRDMIKALNTLEITEKMYRERGEDVRYPPALFLSILLDRIAERERTESLALPVENTEAPGPEKREKYHQMAQFFREQLER